MAHGPRYRVPFRRRREGKTDYHQRVALVRSGWKRLVVRKSLKHMAVQVVEAHQKGDRTLASSHSSELHKFGWTRSCSNVPAAYLTGYLCGLKARKEGIERAVMDLGLQRVVRGCRAFAALAGVVDAGVEVPLSEDVLPSPERRKGAPACGELVDTVVKNMKEALQ